jgi:hypothetical protein
LKKPPHRLILPGRGNHRAACPAVFAKRFWFASDPNHFYIHRYPALTRGRIAIVTDVGRGMRWTRQYQAPNKPKAHCYRPIRVLRLRRGEARCNRCDQRLAFWSRVRTDSWSSHGSASERGGSRHQFRRMSMRGRARRGSGKSFW